MTSEGASRWANLMKIAAVEMARIAPAMASINRVWLRGVLFMGFLAGAGLETSA
jgi:hypothetical protein